MATAPAGARGSSTRTITSIIPALHCTVTATVQASRPLAGRLRQPGAISSLSWLAKAQQTCLRKYVTQHILWGYFVTTKRRFKRKFSMYGEYGHYYGAKSRSKSVRHCPSCLSKAHSAGQQARQAEAARCLFKPELACQGTAELSGSKSRVCHQRQSKW